MWRHHASVLGPRVISKNLENIMRFPSSGKPIFPAIQMREEDEDGEGRRKGRKGRKGGKRGERKREEGEP